METKVSTRADFGDRISVKWNTDNFFFIRRENHDICFIEIHW